MIKELKNYLHLYLGCKVEYGYEGTKKIGKLEGKVDLAGWQVNTYKVLAPYQYVRDELIKPILRPLSDMTDAEFKEAILLHWGISRDIVEQKIDRVERRKELKQNVRYGTAIPYSAFDKEGKHYMTGTFSTSSLSPDTLLFLLSKHFDLFGLIEAGLAIDKTTLK